VARARVLLIYLCTGSSFGAIAVRSFLVPLRAHELGVDRLQVGLLSSVSLLLGAALALPVGVICDRFGRRAVLAVAIGAGALSEVLFSMATSLEAMYLAQLLLGLMAGAAQTALFAALADSVPAARLGRSIGWLTLSMQFGFLAGPATAGAALQFLSIRQDLVAGTAVFVLALALGLLATSGERRTGPVAWAISGPLREVLAAKGFWAVALGLLGAATVWGSLQAYLPLFAKETLGLPGPQIGYLIAVQAVFNGLARIPGGRLVDRSPRRGLLVLVGVLGLAASVAALPHLRGFWLPALVLAIGAPFSAMAFVAMGVTFGSLTSARARSVAMGAYGAGLFGGLGLGPALFGGLMRSQGYVAGFTAAALFGVVMAGAMMAVRALDRRAGAPAGVSGGVDRPAGAPAGVSDPAS